MRALYCILCVCTLNAGHWASFRIMASFAFVSRVSRENTALNVPSLIKIALSFACRVHLISREKSL